MLRSVLYCQVFLHLPIQMKMKTPSVKKKKRNCSKSEIEDSTQPKLQWWKSSDGTAGAAVAVLKIS